MSNNQLPADVQERIKQQAAYYSSYSEDRDCKPVDKGRYYGYIAGATAEAQCKLKYDELVAENEALRRWKEEATRLLSNIYAYSGRHPEMKLGQDTVEFVIARAKERDALKERCEKMVDIFRMIVNAPVPANEREYISWFVTAKNIAGGAISEWEAEKYVAELKEGESNTPAPVQGEKEIVKIRPRLVFKNVHMPNHSFEIHSVDPANNKLAVNIRSANRLCWTEIDWNLEHTQWAFEKGEYYIPK